MGLETGTYIDDLVTTNPVGASDNINQGDDHLRLIKSVLKNTLPNATRAFRFEDVVAKSAAYTVAVTDARALILCDATSAAFTVTLPLSSSIFTGFSVTVMKGDSTGNDVTVDGNGAETINGAATSVLTLQYQSEEYIWDGSEWKIIATTFNDTISPAFTETAEASLTDQSQVDITGIASGTQLIYVNVTGAQMNGSNDSISLRIGDGVGGIEGNGYRSTNSFPADTTSRFLGMHNVNENQLYSGVFTLVKSRGVANWWHCTSMIFEDFGSLIQYQAGRKSLSHELDRVRLSAESQTFAAGTFNVSYM